MTADNGEPDIWRLVESSNPRMTSSGREELRRLVKAVAGETDTNTLRLRLQELSDFLARSERRSASSTSPNASTGILDISSNPSAIR